MFIPNFPDYYLNASSRITKQEKEELIEQIISNEPLAYGSGYDEVQAAREELLNLDVVELQEMLYQQRLQHAYMAGYYQGYDDACNDVYADFYQIDPEDLTSYKGEEDLYKAGGL